MQRREIGPYQIVSKLGDGGYATVWAAKDGRDGSEVALKLLRPELIREETKSGPSPVQRFLAEAELLQRLDHPGMIKVIDKINRPQEGVVAFAMERLIGSDLYQMSRTDRIELPLLLEVLSQVAMTLGHLHEHGIIHRDVKQSNIFVCAPGTHGTRPVSRLLDFGIAKQLDEETEQEHTRQGSMVGTSHLITPEVLDRAVGKDVQLTGAVDQWGLGVVLYKCLTGKFPFNSEDYATLLMKIRKWPPPMMVLKRRFNLSKVPGCLDNIVRRSLAKRPEERYSSAHSMSKYLVRARGELFDLPASTDVSDSATQLIWDGPSGPLDLAALPSHQAGPTRVISANDDLPTSLQSNPLQVPQVSTVPNNISNAKTQAQLESASTKTGPRIDAFPKPPIEPREYDEESLATEVQFQKPDWEQQGIAAKLRQASTGPLPAPSVEAADTRILPRYDLDTLEKGVVSDHSSTWSFGLILAIVFLGVFIIYFLFS
jgi:serine/threonine protein kinase